MSWQGLPAKVPIVVIFAFICCWLRPQIVSSHTCLDPNLNIEYIYSKNRPEYLIISLQETGFLVVSGPVVLCYEQFSIKHWLLIPMNESQCNQYQKLINLIKNYDLAFIIKSKLYYRDISKPNRITIQSKEIFSITIQAIELNAELERKDKLDQTKSLLATKDYRSFSFVLSGQNSDKVYAFVGENVNELDQRLLKFVESTSKSEINSILVDYQFENIYCPTCKINETSDIFLFGSNTFKYLKINLQTISKQPLIQSTNHPLIPSQQLFGCPTNLCSASFLTSVTVSDNCYYIFSNKWYWKFNTTKNLASPRVQDAQLVDPKCYPYVAIYFDYNLNMLVVITTGGQLYKFINCKPFSDLTFNNGELMQVDIVAAYSDGNSLEHNLYLFGNSNHLNTSVKIYSFNSNRYTLIQSGSISFPISAAFQSLNTFDVCLVHRDYLLCVHPNDDTYYQNNFDQFDLRFVATFFQCTDKYYRDNGAGSETSLSDHLDNLLSYSDHWCHIEQIVHNYLHNRWWLQFKFYLNLATGLLLIVSLTIACIQTLNVYDLNFKLKTLIRQNPFFLKKLNLEQLK